MIALLVKRCPRCQGEFELEDFSSAGYCKPCNRARALAWNRAHPEKTAEKVRVSMRKRWAADPEFRARSIEKNREWKAANPEAVREHHVRSTPAQRARHAEHQAARRAATKGVVVQEHVERSVVFERDGGLCGICGDPVLTDDWHMDHVVPLALGGEHSYANVQVSHPACNLSKGGRSL